MSGICQDEYTASLGWEFHCLPRAGEEEQGRLEVAARAGLLCDGSGQAGQRVAGRQAAQPHERSGDGASWVTNCKLLNRYISFF